MAFDTVQGVQLVLSKRQAMGLATGCYLGLDSGDIVSAQVLLICGSSLGLQAIRRPHTTTGAVNPDKVVGMLTRFRGSLRYPRPMLLLLPREVLAGCAAWCRMRLSVCIWLAA